jgi:hypothetical protein
LRYAIVKKLRPEQRDEVDTFLLVSAIILPSFCGPISRLGHRTWPAS